MTKMTYAMALEIAINAVADNAEVAEKLTALKASLAKKSSTERKPTKAHLENKVLKEAIASAMEVGKQYTISDLMKSVEALDGASNQKVSALLKQMKDEGIVVKEEIKRKAYFSLA